MKKSLLFLSMLGLSMLGWIGLAGAASAADIPAPAPAPVLVPLPGPELGIGRLPPVIVQLGPTTSYSTINCAEFVKLPEGPWKAVGAEPFGLGFVQGIVPPKGPIKSGGYIYNNIDLYSQLEEQCVGSVIKARY